jgi:hypothetical protein
MKIRVAILELLHAEGQTDGVFSLLGITEELLERKIAAPV